MRSKYKRFLRIGIPTLISLFLIVVTSLLFIQQMNKMISANTVNTINELAEHDMSTIVHFVESKWANLENIAKRMVVYDCDSIHNAQERLILERSTSDFYTLLLIDEDNIIYSDKYIIYTDDELGLLPKLEWRNDKQIVRRFDYKLNVDTHRETLLYAIKLDNLVIDGKKIVALVGISNITAIQDNLFIYYFQDEDNKFRGYSSVVNYYGDYIVNLDSSSSLNKQQNLFDLLDAGKITNDLDTRSIAKKMTEKEIFRCAYTDVEGVKKLLYFMPIEKNPWYFISVVEEEVFSEQTRSFIVISVSMIIVALGITASMLLLVAKSNRAAMLARAETKARSEFLSNMSHEIRTPLNGIIGLLYLMRSHLGDENRKELKTLLEKTDDSAQYLLSLVSDILDMSKLRAEKMKLSPEPFMLDKMLLSVADMQRANAENHGVFLRLDSIIKTPNVIGDETRLKQVLMNIIGNSVKFTPSGGKITIKARQGEVIDDRVEVKIVCSDTGVGMSEEFQKTIWDSFTQEHNKLSNGIRGTGLGMAISKGIIDAMGGTITVKSKLNEGSVFTINFKLPVTDSAMTEDELAQEEKLALTTGEGLKLIVAEDNELNAEILTEILKMKGFLITYAENGRIARDIFTKSAPNEYQAILMDMQMPVMDGCEATRQIRASNHPNASTIKIFACTANVFQEDKDRALASGMDDFLIKPVDVNLLLEKLTTKSAREIAGEKR